MLFVKSACGCVLIIILTVLRVWKPTHRWRLLRGGRGARASRPVAQRILYEAASRCARRARTRYALRVVFSLFSSSSSSSRPLAAAAGDNGVAKALDASGRRECSSAMRRVA